MKEKTIAQRVYELEQRVMELEGKGDTNPPTQSSLRVKQGLWGVKTRLDQAEAIKSRLANEHNWASFSNRITYKDKWEEYKQAKESVLRIRDEMKALL